MVTGATHRRLTRGARAGWARAAAGLLAMALLTGGVAWAVAAWPYWIAEGILGCDYRILTDAAARWLAGGPFYAPFQLAGPYVINQGPEPPIMYPPTTLLLFAPFAVLPAVLWWAVPLAVTAGVVWHHAPRPLVWPFLALLVAFPQSVWIVATGNPTLWLMAAIALGTVRGPWAVLVLLKPSLAPFAIIGVWRRSWWLGAAVMVLVSIPFAGLWADYATVLRHTLAGNSPLYSLNQVPMLAIPVIAWLGRRDDRRPSLAPTSGPASRG